MQLDDTGFVYKKGRSIKRDNIGLFAASPNWKSAAYSQYKVWIKGTDTSSLCEIKTVRWFPLIRKNQTLVDTARSARYAAYSSFPFSLTWNAADTIESKIADGDVDYTLIKVGPKTGKIYLETFQGEDPEPMVSLEQRRVIRQFMNAFPKLKKEALENMVLNACYDVGEGRFIGQFHYAGYSDDVVLFDLLKKEQQVILSFGKRIDYADGLRSVVRYGSYALMALQSPRKTTRVIRYNLETYRADVVSILEKESATRFKEKKMTDTTGCFWMEFPDNPVSAYYYSGGRLFDLKVDPTIRRMQFSEKGNRCLLLSQAKGKWKLTRTRFKVK